MATKPDLYTVPQAAKVLGLSVKRIRQMLQEGKLEQYGENPVTIKQVEVITLRQKRESEGKIARPQEPKRDAIAEALESLSQTFTKQLELVADSNKRNEENLLNRINQLETEVNSLRARKWFKR
jgi:DNA-binding transcriptional MerR regulator